MKFDHASPVNWLINVVVGEPEIKYVAEVGVWKGETLCHYAPDIRERDGVVYAVDWFQGNESEVYKGPEARQVHYYREEPTDEIFTDFITNIVEIDCDGTVHVLRGKSWEQAAAIEDGTLDLCFIDASHSYEDVKRDIQAYRPKVKAGGLLCGHDYNQPEVAQAVREMLPDHYTEQDPTAPIWVYRIPCDES